MRHPIRSKFNFKEVKFSLVVRCITKEDITQVNGLKIENGDYTNKSYTTDHPYKNVKQQDTLLVIELLG